MTNEVEEFLRDRGASDAEVERAELEGWLPLLVIDRLIMPGRRDLDLAQVASRAGVPTEVAQRIWRAVGFPDVLPGVPAFDDEAVQALQRATARFDPTVDPAPMLRQTRVISSALARIAAVEADLVADLLADLRRAGADDREVAGRIIETLDWGSVEQLVDYVHRLQFRAAVWRRLVRGGDATMIDVGIGFADLSGYTALSERLDSRELDALLARWEELGYDTVAEHGCRVIKTIGDEVMFAGLADAVAATAIELARRASADPDLLDARIGIAAGPVLARDGDFYGPVVNLASRLTRLAEHGTVIASESIYRALADHPGLEWALLGTRHARDIGDVEVYRVGTSDPQRGLVPGAASGRESGV